CYRPAVGPLVRLGPVGSGGWSGHWSGRWHRPLGRIGQSPRPGRFLTAAKRIMSKRVGLLVAGTLLVWAVVADPARVFWGDVAIGYSAVAVVLCLLPAAATLLWAGWVSRHSPEQELLMVLGGTGVRMFVVLGVALVLFLFVPFFGEPSFLLWLSAFYLLTL